MMVRGGGAAAKSNHANSKMADDDEGTTEATAFAPRQIAHWIPRQHGAPNRDAASRPPTHTILGVQHRLQRRQLAAEVNGEDRQLWQQAAAAGSVSVSVSVSGSGSGKGTCGQWW